MKITKEQEKEIFRQATKKGDKFVMITFISMFSVGILLSFFYDTLDVAVGVGGLNLAAYFISKSIFKETKFYQYVAGVIFPLFMAQYIYQMHGMFEMHFFAFFGSVVMIGYQDWKLQIPLLLTVVAHHSTFAYLQYSGVEDIYYTQMDYMDLDTFIIHALIAAIIIFVCGYWGYDLAQKTISGGIANIQLSSQLEIVEENKLFAEEIAKGNLEVEFTNEKAKEDELGQALVRMKSSLQEASQNEQKERFITEGINKLSELFQQYSNEPRTYYTKCINFLTEYMEVVQGAIYVVGPDEEDPILYRKATYAYDRNKFVEETVKPGVGLVGQCFLEQKNIYMTNVPQDYLKIKSGLGDAEPGCVLIFPLISNEKIMGIIEIAGFHALSEHKLQFVDRVSESLAASINTLRTADSTQQLLLVSQDQQEQMRQQEEEMRQNLEEMNATQEEMHGKEMQRDAQMRAIGSAAAYIEFTPEGEILKANQLFQKAMQYDLQELVGNHHSMFCDRKYVNSSDYKDFWNKLGKGEPFSGEVKRIKKNRDVIWLNASYTPVKDENGRVFKVIKLATDITEQKLLSSEVSAKMEAINSSSAYIEFTPLGKILTANTLFLNTLGYKSLSEIKGQHHKIFCDKEYIKTPEYGKFWDDLEKGNSKSGEFKRFSKTGEEVWITASYTPVKNEKGEVVKVIKLANDITSQKQISLESAAKMDAINSTAAYIEFTPMGEIIIANNNFIKAMRYAVLDEIIGQHHSMFCDSNYTSTNDYIQFWEDLGNGKSKTGEFMRVAKTGEKVWISATYTPVKNEKGEVIKVIKIAQDITQQKEHDLDVEGQLNAIGQSFAVIEFDLYGNILKANNFFCSAMGYKEDEIVGKHHGIFVGDEYRESDQYKYFWESLGEGNANSGTFERYTKDGTKVTLQAAYSPIYNSENQAYKVVKYAMVV